MKVALLRLPADHPSAAGHFPGNPMVPAAVLLDEILAAVERVHGKPAAGSVLKSVRFQRPVRPGDVLELELSTTRGGDIRFCCRADTLEVVTGLVQA